MPITDVFVKLKSGESTTIFPLSNYYLDFDQTYDSVTGKTSGAPNLTQCRITLLTALDNSLADFVAWEIARNQQNDLDIEFMDDGNLVKTYNFTQAFLVSLEHAIQQYHDRGWQQSITLHLSPESCTIEGKTYRRPQSS